MKVDRYTKFVSIVMMGMLAGCHGQQMLRRDPASFSMANRPILLGLVTTEDVAITFDEPGTMESGQVVYRVDGTRASMSLDDIDHLVLVQRTLDMTKTLMAVLGGFAVIGVALNLAVHLARNVRTQADVIEFRGQLSQAF